MLLFQIGTFSENYDDLTQSHVDGSCFTSSSATVTNCSPNSLSNNLTVNNSQTQSPPLCTVQKRLSKLNSAAINSSDGLSPSNSNSLVQSITRNNKLQISTMSNGHDDGSLSYKQQKQNSSLSNFNTTNVQQKKQPQKSSNTQQQTATNTQSRRQSKKQEQIHIVSRDSSASQVNGFGTTTSNENSDIEKR